MMNGEYGKSYYKNNSENVRDRIRTGEFLLGVCLLCALFGRPVYSQNVTVSAEVGPQRIRLDAFATLRLTVSGQTQLNQIHAPKFEPLPEFMTVYGGSSSRYGLDGNQMVVTITWSYQLIPRKVGQFRLPPFQIPYGTEVYQTNSVSITVIPAQLDQLESSSVQDTFTDSFSGGIHRVEASISHDRAYVNEQITYTLRYLYTVQFPSLDSPSFREPPWSHFLARKHPLPRRRTEVIDGTKYSVIERDIALFPMTVGKTVIEPAQLLLPSSEGLQAASTVNRLSTRSLQINVQPLPDAGQPHNFSGAVGDYDIKAQVDNTTVVVGEGITLTLLISGTGNIETLQRPMIPEIPNVTIHPSTVIDDVSVDTPQIRGSRTYEYVIVPDRTMRLVIPAIEYTYFQPQDRHYRVTQTEPISLLVEPNSKAAESDITTILTSSDSRRPHQAIVPVVTKYWWLSILPIVAGLTTWYYRRRRDRPQPLKQHQHHPMQHALKIIEQREKKRTGGSVEIAALVASSLYQYVGDILNISSVGLTPESVRQGCKRVGLSESAIKPLVELLAQCDQVRFAPVSDLSVDTGEIVRRAKGILQQFETERPHQEIKK